MKSLMVFASLVVAIYGNMLLSVLPLGLFYIYGRTTPIFNAEAIITAVNSANTTWKAGHNFARDIPLRYIKSLLGVMPSKTNSQLPIKTFQEISDRDIPAEFDARKQWPNCPIGHIVDQGTCGSCWPCEHHTTGKRPQCADLPSSKTPRCKHSCINPAYETKFSSDHHNLKTVYTISRNVSEIQKEIMTGGPVEVSFAVHSDFLSYKEGVYQYTTGKYLGAHAVRLIGWELKKASHTGSLLARGTLTGVTTATSRSSGDKMNAVLNPMSTPENR